MRLQRSLNAKRNIIYGVINKVVLIVLPFLIRTIMIKSLGEQYLGVKGLFTSILQVFNLTELGVGSAIVYSMYKPIAENDDKAICALLNLYRKIYKVIGLAILIMGIVLVPIIPFLIKGDYPQDINIRVVFILYLLDTVLSYWMYAYKISLLSAFQRNDIISKISTLVFGCMHIVQIVVLILCKNYYYYLIAALLFTILNNIVVSTIVDKMFPKYKASGKVDGSVLAEIKEKVSGLVIYKICNTTRNSFDSIFISMFLGLSITAAYDNYYYILTAVSGVICTITVSLVAGVGNSIKTDSIEKNLNDMEIINYIYMIISGVATVYLTCLYQPFIEWWMGKKMLLPIGMVVLLSMYFYIQRMGEIRAVYADAAGLWWENRYRALAESVCNIILNYVLVIHFGLYGIIIATLITLFVFGYLCSGYILYRCYFKKGLKKYLIQNFTYAIVTVIVCFIIYNLCSVIKGNMIVVLLARFVVCSIITPLLFYLIYFKTNIFLKSKEWFMKRIKIRG